ncbi:MAG: response regulator [Myxococcota bacterium]
MGSRGPDTEPNGGVLVVEDDAGVRLLLQRVLQNAGYRVVVASGPEEALELVERGCVRVDLLVSDLVMPVMTGRALAERLARYLPGLRTLLISGYPDDNDPEGELPVAFLQKPFTPLTLTRTVEAVLSAG